jgi:uncharacterized beta-barrel protein YwiB (DUF1934 family)
LRSAKGYDTIEQNKKKKEMSASHMTYDIIINIKGTQSQEGRQEKTEMTTEGSLVFHEGSGTISYGDMQNTAFLDYTEITVRDEMIIMKKKGEDEVEFVFETGKLYTTVQSSPFGEVHVSVLPTLVDVKLGDVLGKIELEYVIDIGGVQTVNRLNLNYVADKNMTCSYRENIGGEQYDN